MVKEKTKELYDKALKWIYRKKFYGVKAKIEPFEAPKTFQRKQDDSTIAPDITALRNERKSFFDIVLKKEARRRLAGKWRLMQELASRSGGKLYLFTPKGHHAFAERVVEKYGLEANIIRLF
ncbi:MAG: hypothetical protein H6574_25740 [Lewinellaceae bacterium]|nr:hypothetical protein [Saprospiraceae bacterium]MCB9315024.1 hypothetical protein [Lewinellaceae bacterium]MCB9329815.1 hypothetical protein [Lewinellaceae bacterium]MCB9334464.1 hypothetical protein [Lewinellaceae bacterium]